MQQYAADIQTLLGKTAHTILAIGDKLQALDDTRQGRADRQAAALALWPDRQAVGSGAGLVAADGDPGQQALVAALAGEEFSVIEIIVIPSCGYAMARLAMRP